LPEELLAGLNQGKLVLELAARVVEARIAEGARRAEAVGLWQAAVELEESAAYNEPADWFNPTRHYLGAALLDLGRAKEAEVVYLADLERHPRNGWALFGLWKALAAQGRASDAARVRGELTQAFRGADVELARSAF
jgi:hypothetical protein